jgi:hypothetical protein
MELSGKLLLVLASTDFFGSDSRWTHAHILVSKLWESCKTPSHSVRVGLGKLLLVLASTVILDFEYRDTVDRILHFHDSITAHGGPRRQRIQNCTVDWSSQLKRIPVLGEKFTELRTYLYDYSSTWRNVKRQANSSLGMKKYWILGSPMI